MAPPHPFNVLSDTGENRSVEEEAGTTPTPEELERLAHAPATMLWVIRLLQASSSKCWVRRWARSMRLTLAFVLGATAAIQVVGWVSLRAAQKELIRQTIEEVLKERKLVQAGPAPRLELASAGGVP